MNQVTRILLGLQRGDQQAAVDFLPLVYDELAAHEPRAAEVVKLRYFAGLTADQAADALGISLRTASRHWAYAKAWLYEQLSGNRPDAGKAARG